MSKDERREKDRLKSAKFRKENPTLYYTQLAKRVSKWRKKYPQRYKAHKLVFVEVRSGRLVKKDCFCGSKKSEAHHKDYSKPLAVVWLCKKHHRMADRGDIKV